MSTSQNINILYKGSKASIEATSNPVEGFIAYATDTNELGFYSGSSWSWLSATMGNTLYLKLDASNDPLTAQLDITPSTPGDGGIYISTAGDAFSLDVEQLTTNTNVTSPNTLLIQYTDGTGSFNGNSQLIHGLRYKLASGVYNSSWIKLEAVSSGTSFEVDKDGITYTNGLVVNDSGGDFDTRIESDTESNILLVDASADKVYIGGNTNAITIEKGGKFKAVGTATWFDDIRVEPTVRLASSKSPTYTNYAAGGGASGIYFYLFDNAVVANEKEVNFKIQMPHGKLLGSAIHLHVHWVPTSTGSAGDKVRWGLEYTKANPNGTFGTTTTIYATDPVDPPSTTPTTHTHYITEFADIDMTGDALSTILLCRLFRNSSNVADTFAGDVGLLYIDCHVEFSQLGSNDEYTQ